MYKISFFAHNSRIFEEFCDIMSLNDSSKHVSADVEFKSLLIEWNHECRESPVTIFFSSAVMIGAVIGSLTSGFLADRFGRKPLVVGGQRIFGITFFTLFLSQVHVR